MPHRAPILVVMGVTGAGKSTVAQILAGRLGCPMLEGDSLHPPQNIRLMASGVALTDENRRGWLTEIAQQIAAAAAMAQGLVVSCSALRRCYRDVLRQADPDLVLVYLAGDRALLERRLAARHGHFMSPTLLDSQFQTLEIPDPDEHAIGCDIARDPADIASRVLAQLPAAGGCGRRA